MASIEEAGHIVRDETAPSRTFTVEREPLDVTGIREGYKLSQTRFTALPGISVKPLAIGNKGGIRPRVRRVFSSKWQQKTLMPSGMLCIPSPGDISHLVPLPTRMAEQTQVAAAPADRVAERLKTLVTVGRARQTTDGRFVE